MISDKMKPVIIILLVILVVLFGMQSYQHLLQSDTQVKSEGQIILESWAQYLVDLQKHIKSYIHFDNTGLCADVTFDIDKSGKISNVQLSKTSSNAQFDNQVIGAVKKSSPCAPLPKKYNGNGITVNLTLGGEIAGSQIVKEW